MLIYYKLYQEKHNLKFIKIHGSIIIEISSFVQSRTINILQKVLELLLADLVVFVSVNQVEHGHQLTVSPAISGK